MEVEDSQNGLGEDENSTLPEDSIQEGEEDENSNSASNFFEDEEASQLSLKPDDSQSITNDTSGDSNKKDDIIHEIPESSVRKWKKKWVTVEHMKLLKWVPGAYYSSFLFSY